MKHTILSTLHSLMQRQPSYGSAVASVLLGGEGLNVRICTISVLTGKTWVAIEDRFNPDRQKQSGRCRYTPAPT